MSGLEKVNNVEKKEIDAPTQLGMRLMFIGGDVRQFTAADFNLDTPEKVTLKWDDCIIILFYVQNKESYEIASLWAETAAQIAGPILGAVNLLTERKIAEAFTSIRTDGSSIFHWLGLRQIPFILVYRKRNPVAFYNGARSTQAMVDYILTLACKSNYYEQFQLGGSAEVDTRNEMSSYQPYRDIPGSPKRVREMSEQYTSANPVRGFNSRTNIVEEGSKEAIIETQDEIIREEQGFEAGKQGVDLSNIQNSELPRLPEVAQ